MSYISLLQMQHNHHYPNPQPLRTNTDTGLIVSFILVSPPSLDSIPCHLIGISRAVSFFCCCCFAKEKSLQVFICSALPLSLLHLVVINFNLK